MCTNAYVMERIERFMARLRAFKKTVEAQLGNYLREGRFNAGALLGAIEVERELVKILDYVGILMRDPEEELVKPMRTVLEMLRAFLSSPSRELAHGILAQISKIPV